MFPLWLLGVLACMAPPPGSRWPSLLAFPFLGVALMVSSSVWNLLGDYLVGLATFALIWSLRAQVPIHSRWFAWGTSLAAFSFTLYAVHYPLVRLLQHRFVPVRLAHAGIVQWLGLLVMGLCVMAVVYLVYFLFERNTSKLRRWIESTMVIQPVPESGHSK